MRTDLFAMIGTAKALTGYQHHAYAESLAEFGRPRRLPKSGGWILERPIPGFTYRDAMGSYPLFACQDWSRLHDDLDDLGRELVSLSLVSDPFGEYDLEYLRQCFQDVVIPFKEHFVVDLSRPINVIISKHHRYYARKALSKVQVESYLDPPSLLDEWESFYENLVERHRLRGIKAFSRNAFARQLSIPGLVMFRATHRGVPIAAHLWYVHGDVAYSHLEASNSAGYDLMAPYALYRFAIDFFANKIRWLNLGGGAGVTKGAADGLSRFKKGWSTATRTAYFCGRIFDAERYAEIVKVKGDAGTSYFPAYRSGEFE
jgi:Acetyltransferase (GNAT) domain